MTTCVFKLRHWVCCVAILALGGGIYYGSVKLLGYSAWNDPMKLRGMKRLWAKSLSGGLEDHDISDVAALIGERIPAARTLLAVVVEYPDDFHQPIWGAELEALGTGEKTITEYARELRRLSTHSVWSVWSDRNWTAMQEWLKVNLSNLRVNKNGNRFVLKREEGKPN